MKSKPFKRFLYITFLLKFPRKRTGWKARSALKGIKSDTQMAQGCIPVMGLALQAGEQDISVCTPRKMRISVPGIRHFCLFQNGDGGRSCKYKQTEHSFMLR